MSKRILLTLFWIGSTLFPNTFLAQVEDQPWSEINSGGIAAYVQVLGGQNITHARLKGSFGYISNFFEINAEGFVFIDTDLTLLNKFKRIEIFEFIDEDYLLRGHISYEYKPLTENSETRHVWLIVHDEPAYGVYPNSIVPNWNYFTPGEYPVSMLIPPNNIFPESFSNSPTLFVHGLNGQFKKPDIDGYGSSETGYWANVPTEVSDLAPSVDPWQVYYPYDDFVRKNAIRLNKSGELLLSLYNGQQMPLISHSMGGLVAYFAAVTPDLQNDFAEFAQKLLILGSPIHGSHGENTLVELEGLDDVSGGFQNLFAGGVIPYDPSAPITYDMGLASRLMFTISSEDPIPLGSGDVTSDYFCFIGTTDEAFATSDIDIPNIALPQTFLLDLIDFGWYNESRLHDDGIVSMSSVSLIDKGIGFATLHGNHEDLKWGHPNLDEIAGNQSVTSNLFKDFILLSSSSFISALEASVEVTTIVTDSGVIKPLNTEYDDLYDGDSETIFEKGLVCFQTIMDTPFDWYQVAFDPETSTLNVFHVNNLNDPSILETGWEVLDGHFLRNKHSYGPASSDTSRFYFRDKVSTLDGGITQTSNFLDISLEGEVCIKEVKPEKLRFYPHGDLSQFIQVEYEHNYCQSHYLTLLPDQECSNPLIIDLYGPESLTMGETGVYQAVTNGTSCTWSIDGVPQPGEGCLISYTITEDVTISVASENECGEVESINIQVSANPYCSDPPSADAGQDVIILSGDSYQLQGSGGTLYSWISYPSGFSSNEQSPVVSPEVNTTYELTATNSEGCIATDCVNVFVEGGTNPAPSNDLCENAIHLDVGEFCEITAFDLTGATPSLLIIPECDTPGNHDIWFTFTVPSTGLLGLYSESITLAGDDIGVAFYTGMCDSLEEIYCITNGNGWMPYQPIINLQQFAGQTLYLRAWDFGEIVHEGLFGICLFQTDIYNPPGLAGLEYWFDHELNSREYIAVDWGDLIDSNLGLDASSLSRGLHLVTIRTQGNDGAWSTPWNQLFFKADEFNSDPILVSTYEYWFDDDIENRIETVVNNTSPFELTTSLELSESLSAGLHNVNVRFKDSNGRYTDPYSRLFYNAGPVMSEGTISELKFWFDHDLSTAQTQTFDGNQTSLTFTGSIQTEELQKGMHTISYRFKDSNDNWSSPHNKLFYSDINSETSSTEIVAYRYWFNDNPESAEFNFVAESTSVYSLEESLATTGVPEGPGQLFHIQFQNSAGAWSGAWCRTFEKILNACLMDIDNNGSIGATDMLILLGSFGCTADCGIPDINQDGIVGTPDMLAILGAWGASCGE